MRILILSFVLLMAPRVSAAWTHVQSDKTGSDAGATTIALAYPSNVTSGSLLVLTVGWYSNGGETVTGVADSRGQNWSLAGSPVTVLCHVGGNFSVAIYYFANTSTGANTVTVTFSTLTAFRAMIASEYSGIATSSTVDQTAGQPQVDAPTTTDGVTSGNVVTTAAGDLVYGGSLLAPGVSITYASGTGFTSRGIQTTAFTYVQSEDKNLPTATTTAATFTNDNAGADTATIVVTFKQPAAPSTSSGKFFILLK